MERTLIVIKPEGVKRGLVGKIIQRFEEKGFELISMKTVHTTRELIKKHYAEHAEKPFFGPLVGRMAGEKVVAMVWRGEGVVKLTRKMIGSTDPVDAERGTIRGDFAACKTENVVHGSDSVESAEREIDLWFPPEQPEKKELDDEDFGNSLFD